eukprot:TRINITY_DN30152_c0_g1_i1.p1 TRINITY_DN30152_c0_g1~~TRINITY_DN30152_c0_g1_i1.p1  ORF type:complete len:157 (-),score=47.83 TRINITY_DN30152_c0_g1_i1:233-703(-)
MKAEALSETEHLLFTDVDKSSINELLEHHSGEICALAHLDDEEKEEEREEPTESAEKPISAAGGPTSAAEKLQKPTGTDETEALEMDIDFNENPQVNGSNYRMMRSKRNVRSDGPYRKPKSSSAQSSSSSSSPAKKEAIEMDAAMLGLVMGCKFKV